MKWRDWEEGNSGKEREEREGKTKIEVQIFSEGRNLLYTNITQVDPLSGIRRVEFQEMELV